MSDRASESFGKFSARTRAALVAAQRYAEAMETSLGSEHILLALAVTADSTAYTLLRRIPITLDQLRLVLQLESRPRKARAITNEARAILERAAFHAATHGAEVIDTEHVLWALVSDASCTAYRMIQQLGVEPKNIRKTLEQHLHEHHHSELLRPGSEIEILGFVAPPPTVEPVGDRPSGPALAPSEPEPEPSETPMLDEFSTELVAAASAGQLDPVIGRLSELERVIHILGRKTKNNPVLVGDPGVGKTAIAEGLAARIAAGTVPGYLADAKLYVLELANVVAGTMFRGQFEERLRRIVGELVGHPNTVLFIDELHTIIGAGGAEGALDAANILKPLLAKGKVRLIGATTTAEYRRYIEKDAALERRLQPVYVTEPSAEETELILRGLAPRYEEFHGVSLPDPVIREAVRIAGRYLPDRRFPDKAIDLIDEASAVVRASHQPPTTATSRARMLELEREIKVATQEKAYEFKASNLERAAYLRDKEAALRRELKKLVERPVVGGTRREVTTRHLYQVASRWSGVPLDELQATDRERLLRLPTTLRSQILGQPEAMHTLAASIRRAKAGLRRARGPIGTFLLVGPTGVGKTETARVLAREVFGDERALLKFDMSEFMERHQAARLVGAPPGSVGHDQTVNLLDALRRRPHQVVLFDEIEKAHPDILNLLLQVMEDGVITDGKGQKIHFHDTLLLLTSNLGSELWGSKGILGFGKGETDLKLRLETVHDRVKKQFRPEFLSRLDEVVIYRPLTPETLRAIIGLELDHLATRLQAEHKVSVTVSPEAREHLVNLATTRGEGARAIRQTIETEIGSLLAETVLTYPRKRIVQIEVRNGTLIVPTRARRYATA